MKSAGHYTKRIQKTINYEFNRKVSAIKGGRHNISKTWNVKLGVRSIFYKTPRYKKVDIEISQEIFEWYMLGVHNYKVSKKK